MKKIIYTVIIIMMIISISTFSMAVGLGTNLDNYASNQKVGDLSKLKKIAGIVLGYVQNIGIACGTILIMLIGFKFVIASVEEKAEYKERMVPWIIGIILLITGTTLPNMIYNMFV